MRDQRWRLSLLLAAAIALAVSPASAQETFKVAIGQLGLWAVDAPRLGQRAGIFKKHGLVLDIFGTSGGGDTLQAVISGSADLTVGIGTAAVLRAYSKGAPIRVIGVNFTGAGDLYWYVRANSPIKRLTDASDATTIAYSASGSSSHNVVLAFLQELGVKATPTATGTQPATLTQVMSGQIDIGWGAPPFALKELAQGKIRIIANGNDVPSLRSQSVRVDMVNADVFKHRRDAVLRFVQAYRGDPGLDVFQPRGGPDLCRGNERAGRACGHDAGQVPDQGGDAQRSPVGHRRGHGAGGAAQVSGQAAQQGAARRADPNPAALKCRPGIKADALRALPALGSPAPGEHGRALLQERAHALGVVGREACLALRLALEVELGVEIVGPGLIEGALDQGKRHRRRCGEVDAELVGLRHQLEVVERFPNEAPGFGLVRGERLGGQRKPAGAGGTDQPRQEPRAPAIGDEADLDEGLHEGRRARRQHDATTGNGNVSSLRTSGL